MPLPILLDTDPGVDDSLALFLALGSPELELLAVTTVAGNVGLEATTRNALLLLELAGRAEIPVHPGEVPPPGSLAVTAADVHGGDGLGGITLLTDERGSPLYSPPTARPHDIPAVEAILEYVRSRPHDLTLVAVGPLTNIARAAELDSDTLRLLKEIVCMGGAFRCPGNITPAAEFNIYVDPDAAQTVLNTGIPLRFVPLDVTEQVLIYPTDLSPHETAAPTNRNTMPRPPASAAPTPNSQLPTPHSTQALLQDLLAHTFDFYVERVGYAGCHLHDPLAIAVLLWPELFRFREAFVEVETFGEVTRGMTVADLRECRQPPAPNCAFAEAVDAPEARSRVLQRLLSM